MSPYQLVYGKACHLPIELEHKALWELKQLNLNWDDATNLRLEQLNDMDEFRLHAYERVDLYKERMEKYNDRRIIQRNFQKGDLVLLFNSRLKLFPGMMEQRLSARHCLFQCRQCYRRRLCHCLCSLPHIGNGQGIAYANVGNAIGAAYAIAYAHCLT
ncbi:hypothetical protein CQW23_01956 [Capsicum baccatum]|uniref:Uncharacterized protein n=1 Tax=Capsicum baccatum TaxID=33114 RepID=A0A2G2XQ12_CAPBA|nr:hypothetical protein CQW23_01956 [Capsicum baccatum]